MTNENRRYKRRHLIYYLQVKEQDTDKFLGYLVDISYKGMLLMSQQPHEPGVVISMKIQLPETEGENVYNFDARVVRCNNDYNPIFYDVGFELLNLDGTAIKKIYRIVQQFGFKDEEAQEEK